MRGRWSLFLMLAHQQREDSSQQRKDQGLDHTHQQLQEIEWNRYQPAKAGDKSGHGLQHVFTGKDGAVETKTEGDGPEQNRNDFQTTDYEEHDHEEYLQRAGTLALGRKQFL